MKTNKKDFDHQSDHRFDHRKSEAMEKRIKLLTKEQRGTFDSLIRLGDSKEIALLTALNEKDYSTELYEAAYLS